MADLLRLQTADFVFTLWANNCQRRYRVYQQAMAKRHSPIPAAALHFTPALPITQSSIPLPSPNSTAPISQLPLTQPLFFENTLYQLEWLFLVPVSQAGLGHPQQKINDGFRFVHAHNNLPARLTGTLNTGNEVGRLTLPWQFTHQGQTQHHIMAFDILPTKMALHEDLPAMYAAIDAQFPLWRFRLVALTQQQASSRYHPDPVPLLWLAQFSELQKQLMQGLALICANPHGQLQAKIRPTKTQALKGPLPIKLAQQLKQDLAQGQHMKRYPLPRQHRTLDTPENRFIKQLLKQCLTQLSQLTHRLHHRNQRDSSPRLSADFFHQLQDWQQALRHRLSHSFLTQVGDRVRPAPASVVLQHKPGYARLYRLGQRLKSHLHALSGSCQASLRSVDEIYEIWCFLQLKQILTQDLGFVWQNPTPSSAPAMDDFLEYPLQDGLAGAFMFSRQDGAQARLAHEPLFTPHSDGLRALVVNQKPDCVLEITLPAQHGQTRRQFIWLFDAKYRIKHQTQSGVDYAPDDAINQMHRYRDALIQRLPTAPDNLQPLQKNRPVLGAFALYPGFFHQHTQPNPYQDNIQQIGIGGFALLPSTGEGDGSHWLRRFLQQQIGMASEPHNQRIERLSVQESARIAYQSLQPRLYSQLVLTCALAGQRGRDPAYFQRFEQGTAQWYHLPQATFLSRFQRSVMAEISYLAIASNPKGPKTHKQITTLWPVKSVVCVRRSSLSDEQAGKVSNENQPVYLFSLGPPLTLANPVDGVPQRPFKSSLRLTTLAKLQQTRHFPQLAAVYPQALA